jgi:hypothetical protein
MKMKTKNKMEKIALIINLLVRLMLFGMAMGLVILEAYSCSQENRNVKAERMREERAEHEYYQALIIQNMRKNGMTDIRVNADGSISGNKFHAK